MEKVYNKAIRDRIPDIIRSNGNECEVNVLSDEDFLIELEKKLGEEIEEYLESGEVMELVDIIEIIYRITELKGTSLKQLEEMRLHKNCERGAFNNNLFLIKTINQ